MNEQDLPDGVKTTLEIDKDGNHHHRFYYKGVDGHHHALEIVLRATDIQRAKADPDFYAKLGLGFVKDTSDWYREAADHANGQKR